MEMAEKRRTAERSVPETAATEAKQNVVDAIAKAPSETQEQLKEVFAAYEREKARETDNLKREVQLYRTLSTTGITAATFSHESSGNPVKVITHSIGAIERRAKKALGDRYDTLLLKPVGSIVRAAETLGVLSSTTLSLINHEKRRLTRVNLHHVISNVFDMFQPFFRGRSVECSLELALGDPWLRGSEAAVESVITNLLNNRLAAFETAGSQNRRISIRSSYLQDDLVVVVSDSGPGIEGIALRDIWLPGVTTRPNGTGLGLTIVKDTVIDLGGRVGAVEHGVFGGAEITVRLPILGSN
jgi:C4-dicarboxylate-specific signal transduction histidine kinase